MRPVVHPMSLVLPLAIACAAGVAILACQDSNKPPAPVASVAVTPSATSLASLGDTLRLTAKARDSNGRELSGRAFVWTSSDQAVATVGASSGLVTAVANGVATVTATSEGVDGHASVTVAQAVATVTVSPATTTLGAIGGTAQLGAAAFDARGHPITGVTFTWTSSDTAIAKVDAAGLVTAAGSGSATVIATAGGQSGSAGVTVAQAAAAVLLTPDTARLAALGATVQLAAAATDSNGHAIATKTFTWTSSDSGVATVSPSGLVTAVANGTATVVTTADGAADSAAVVVAQVLASVAVTPAAPTLDALGRTVQLTAAAQDSNAHTITGKTFSWTSSDAGVATVGAASGLVTAAANGVATITATTDGVDGTAAVTVAQKAAVVTLSPAGALVSGVGATQQFTVEAWDANDSLIPAPDVHAIWTSLNPNVATVGAQSGVATAVGAGQVTIGATVDGVVDYSLLTVTTPGLPPVNLWAQLDYGGTFGVEGVWGTSADNVYAAAGPYALHYDGTSWRSLLADNAYNNMAVWGSSPSDVYFVGNAAKVLHYDGTIWSLGTSGLSNMLSAVWGASPRDIFAVSWDGTIVHSDGARWSSMGNPGGTDFFGVWGASTADVFAIAAHAQSAFHFDGTSWTDISAGITRCVLAVWGVSGTDVYAAGCDGNVFHYDGTGWTWVVIGAPISIWGIWGSSNSDIYFAGADTLGYAAVLHYDGVAWRLTRSPLTATFRDIWGAPTGEVFAVGYDDMYRTHKGAIMRGYRGGAVALAPSTATIGGTGNQLQLTPSASAGGGAVAGVTYLWTSSDSAVATVDDHGLVTGVTNGTATITATALGGAAATSTVTVTLTQAPPVAVIDLPSKDTLITRGESVVFQGTATDADGTIVSHQWDFGDGTGASVEDPGAHTYAVPGVYRAAYRATDDDGATSSAASVVVTVVPNQMPQVAIVSPADGARFAPGDPITFTGVATDHEDGSLIGASLVWTSSIDGQIGTGNSFTRSDLSEGTHTITLTAMDSYGWGVSARVTISVSSSTPLYLRYINSRDVLSPEPAATYTTITLFNYGQGQSTEFTAILGSAIAGTAYGYALWLGSGTGPGDVGSWTATTLVAHGGTRTTLASHTFTVPYNTVFVEYGAGVTGAAGGVAGDTLVFRLTLNGASQGAVRFGPAPLDSHILVPAGVTVTPPTAPLPFAAAPPAGVRVVTGEGPGLRYPSP